MLVIPAIDLLGGACVRLHQGRYDQATVYDASPPSRARAFRAAGATRLHVVDLEGARAGRAAQSDAVRAIVEAFGDGVQVGGGVRTREAFESWLAVGVRRIVLGSAAIDDPELVRALARAHPDVVIVAIDAKGGMVATQGWTKTTSTRAVDLARALSDLPLAGILYTDIARDGTGAGPNVDATAEMAAATALPVIASGGVGTLDHLRALAARDIPACIVGRALYEGAFTLEAAIRAAAEG